MTERESHYTLPKAKACGVFCLETDWTDITRAPSVEPLLELLARSPLRIPAIHRNVVTRDALIHYLDKWTQRRHEDYPILYMGFHGIEGEVQFGDLRRRQNHVSLDELEEHLRGRCQRRVIHFSSCRTLILHERRLQKFLKETGAIAVSGYGRDIDWIRSAVLDMALLAAMQQNAFTATGLRAVRERIVRRYGRETRALKFRMVIRTA
jgi:hypothetical protein